jgi:hypothetical protein
LPNRPFGLPIAPIPPYEEADDGAAGLSIGHAGSSARGKPQGYLPAGASRLDCPTARDDAGRDAVVTTGRAGWPDARNIAFFERGA